MKRVFLLVATLVALGTTAAIAQEETPRGTFSSATRAVAGAPVFVRSVTPCPLIAGAYQFVRVGISPQSHPNDLTYIESTDGDLRSDGSWEVTIAVPVDMPNGITKSYDVQAQCIRNLRPYDTPSESVDDSETEEIVEVSTFRYFRRPLSVTGFGATEVVEGDGPSNTTSTTAAVTTTSVTSAVSAMSSAGRVKVTSAPSSTTREQVPSTFLDDSAERIAEARAELAARGVDEDSMTDREVLLASVTGALEQPAAPVDGGIPWWAFGLAAILAVSAVVAFGVRRTSALSQLDG